METTINIGKCLEKIKGPCIHCLLTREVGYENYHGSSVLKLQCLLRTYLESLVTPKIKKVDPKP